MIIVKVSQHKLPSVLYKPGSNGATSARSQIAHLGGDAPGLVPLQAFLVNEQAHELCHSNGRVCVIHLEASLGWEVLPVLVSSLLVASHHIL